MQQQDTAPASSSTLCGAAGFPSRTDDEPRGNQSIWEVRGAVRVKGEAKILLMALSQILLKLSFLRSSGTATANLDAVSSGQQNTALSAWAASATISVRISLVWTLQIVQGWAES